MRYDRNDTRIAKEVLECYCDSCGSDKIVTLTKLISEKNEVQVLATFVIQHESQVCRIDIRSGNKEYHLSSKTTKKIGEMIDYIPSLKWIQPQGD